MNLGRAVGGFSSIVIGFLMDHYSLTAVILFERYLPSQSAGLDNSYWCYSIKGKLAALIVESVNDKKEVWQSLHLR